jgi:membrane protein DedA with SNARE-associated domain
VSTTPPLPGIFHTLAPLLNHYGYLAVAGFVFVEDFGVPVPGETILIAAAVYAGAGKLNVVLVGLIGFVAAVLGDNVGYAIGRFAGRAVVLRYGKYVFLTEERFDKAEHWFVNHGGKVVTIARFVEGLRQANGVIAGVTEMPWPKFVVFNALGAALWVAVWTTVGYVSGSHLDAVYNTISNVSLYVLAALVVFVVVRIVLHRRKRNRLRAAADGADHGVADDAVDSSESGVSRQAD